MEGPTDFIKHIHTFAHFLPPKQKKKCVSLVRLSAATPQLFAVRHQSSDKKYCGNVFLRYFMVCILYEPPKIYHHDSPLSLSTYSTVNISAPSSLLSFLCFFLFQLRFSHNQPIKFFNCCSGANCTIRQMIMTYLRPTWYWNCRLGICTSKICLHIHLLLSRFLCEFWILWIDNWPRVRPSTGHGWGERVVGAYHTIVPHMDWHIQRSVKGIQ